MKIDRLLPSYVGVTILSLFSGVAYDTGVIVLRPFDVMISLGVLVTAGAASRRGYARVFQKGLPYYLFAILYLYRGLSGLVMTGPVLATKELIQGVEFLFLIHLVAIGTQEESGRMALLKTLLYGFAGIALATAFIHVANGQYAGYKAPHTFVGFMTSGSPKYAFGLFGLMSVVFWVGHREQRWLLMMILALALMLLSGERKGWAGLTAAAGTLLFVGNNLRFRRIVRSVLSVRALALLVAIVPVYYLASQYEYSRRQMRGIGDAVELVSSSGFDYIPARMGDPSNVARYNGLVLVADVLSENPVFGIGTERRTAAVDRFAPGVWVATGHGEYQRYAVENGLVGLLLYMGAWTRIFMRAVRRSKILFTENRTYAAFIVGFVTYSIFVNLFMGGGGINIMFMSVSIGLITTRKGA